MFCHYSTDGMRRRMRPSSFAATICGVLALLAHTTPVAHSAASAILWEEVLA